MKGLQIKRCIRVCLELQKYLKSLKESYDQFDLTLISAKDLINQLEDISRCEMDEEEC